MDMSQDGMSLQEGSSDQTFREKQLKNNAPGEGVANIPLAGLFGTAPSDLQGGRDFGPKPLARESPLFLCFDWSVGADEVMTLSDMVLLCREICGVTRNMVRKVEAASMNGH